MKCVFRRCVVSRGGWLSPGSRWCGTPALVALALLANGCSLLFVDAPPRDAEKLPPAAPIECTSSELAPAIDVGLTALETVRVVLASAASNAAYYGAPISRPVDIALGVSLGLFFLGSAAYGFNTVADCDDARALQHARRVRAARPAPSGAAESASPPPKPRQPAPPPEVPPQTAPPVAPPAGSTPGAPPPPANLVPWPDASSVPPAGSSSAASPNVAPPPPASATPPDAAPPAR